MNLSPAIMMMRQPHACPVRRNFLSGIQVEFKRSLHQRSLRAQLHWLQVNVHTPGHTLGLNLTLLLDSNTGLLVTGGQPVAGCGFPHHLPSSPSTKVHRSGCRFVLLFPLSLKLTGESNCEFCLLRAKTLHRRVCHHKVQPAQQRHPD